MAHGFVYALSNPSMRGIYKIGFTSKHPRTRMAELSNATACPTPFELLAYFGSEFPEMVERDIHRGLSDFRINSMREFFKCPLYEIQDIFRQFGDPSSDCFYSAALDSLADKEMMAIRKGIGLPEAIRDGNQ